MGDTDTAVTLYSAQGQAVRDALTKDGVCFSRRAYVQEKYGESAPVFLTAYDWFAQAAQAFVPKPANAEYPYWAFADLHSLEQSLDQRVLTLRVPMAQAVFFDMYDWNKVLRLQYIGETEAEEKAFRKEMAACGLRETDVLLTGFYPDLKRRVQESWNRLFRHHAAVKAGNTAGVGAVQAALWELKEDWITDQD